MKCYCVHRSVWILIGRKNHFDYSIRLQMTKSCGSLLLDSAKNVKFEFDFYVRNGYIYTMLSINNLVDKKITHVSHSFFMYHGCRS